MHMVQCEACPAEGPQVSSQHAAEEEEHLRTVAGLADLEGQTHSSALVTRGREKEKPGAEGGSLQHGDLAHTHTQRSPPTLTAAKC